MLALEDLKNMSEMEVKEHIASQYCGTSSGSYYHGEQSEEEAENLLSILNKLTILVAYESVGNWGCDSSSWFLFKNKDGELFENSGSHCSCYGFEGQWSPEETSIEYLKSDKFYFGQGGYDEAEEENKQAVKNFLKTL